MTERPILFSAPMVRAILAGQKTQMRRALKTQPIGVPTCGHASLTRSMSKPVFLAAWDERAPDGSTVCVCPYGATGDRLWVREAFMNEPADYCWQASVSIPCRPASTGYRADFGDEATGAGWKPSIHMPRALSRITLEITGVRVERLQAISEADATAEGVETWAAGAMSPEGQRDYSAVGKFERLWSSINGIESWHADPWVWIVEFKRA